MDAAFVGEGESYILGVGLLATGGHNSVVARFKLRQHHFVLHFVGGNMLDSVPVPFRLQILPVILLNGVDIGGKEFTEAFAAQRIMQVGVQHNARDKTCRVGQVEAAEGDRDIACQRTIIDILE